MAAVLTILDNWKYLARPNNLTVQFEQAHLLGHDGDAHTVLDGSAVINMPSALEASFSLYGTPSDLAHSLRAFGNMRANPYDHLARLRFRAHDHDNNLWTGWCEPALEISEGTWTAQGDLGVFNISTTVSTLGTKMLYLANSATEFGRYMKNFTPSDGYRLEAFGTIINFAFDHKDDYLTISFTSSATHPSYYIESWLGQTMRIMFGQPIGPRLTARGGDSGTLIGVQQSNRHFPNARFASLFLWNDGPKTSALFWPLFENVLSLVSSPEANIDLHPVTHFYDEISQASLGSRWVWALTLSSAIEGLTLQLFPDRRRALPPDIMSMIEYIEQWDGSASTRQNVTNQLRQRNTITTSSVLMDLQDQGIVQLTGVKAWKSMRHKVMHGELISPWSKEDEDGSIEALATLFHDLTGHLIRSLRAPDTDITLSTDG